MAQESLSGTRNHADQPTVCDLCGERVLKSAQSAMYYHDDTGTDRHRTVHVHCFLEQRDMSHRNWA